MNETVKTRAADDCITITIEEYRELIETKVKFDLLCKAAANSSFLTEIEKAVFDIHSKSDD